MAVSGSRLQSSHVDGTVSKYKLSTSIVIDFVARMTDMGNNITRSGTGPRKMTITAFEAGSRDIVDKGYIMPKRIMQEITTAIRYRQEDINRWIAKEMWKDGEISETTKKHQHFNNVLRGAEEGFKTLEIVSFKSPCLLAPVPKKNSNNLFENLVSLDDEEPQDSKEEVEDCMANTMAEDGKRGVERVSADQSNDILWVVDLG